MSQKLEDIADKETKKPGKVRRILKRIGLTAGSVLLAGAIAGSYIEFKKEGEPIKGRVNGKIDNLEEIYEIVKENKPVTDITPFIDLINEVNHLNGNTNEFRANIFDEENKSIRVKLTELNKKYRKGTIKGFNWLNGDYYVRNYRPLRFLRENFHEVGHGTSHSLIEHIKLRRKCSKNNPEPSAEKNVIDSIISLMYLDPDLGYLDFAEHLDQDPFHHDWLFAPRNDRWITAIQLNLIRCINDIEIEEFYPSNESVKKIIEERTKGRKTNELIREMYEGPHGILARFEQRFGDREDFEEKYKRLQQLFEYGTTDNLYEEVFFPREEREEKKRKKEEFLKQEHSVMIRDNLKESLMMDYDDIENEELYSFYRPLIDEKVEQGKIQSISPNRVRMAIQYEISQDNMQEAKTLYDLLKQINKTEKDPQAKLRIRAYEPYLE